MKIAVVLFSLVLSGCAYSQSIPIASDSPNIGSAIYSVPADICPQYQHMDHWAGHCGPASCDATGSICTTECAFPSPDRCVDDMHIVTEKEWQSLQGELKNINSVLRVQYDINAATLDELRDLRLAVATPRWEKAK